MLDSIESAIEDIKAGKLVIVVDDDDREDEGDFITAARNITPEVINFMTKHGRGLICVPLLDDRCNELGLELMVNNNTALHETAFTVSVEFTGSPSAYQCCSFRGSVVALELATGKQVWKSYTIAEAPRPTKRNAAGTQLHGPSGAAVDENAGGLKNITDDTMCRQQTVQPEAVTSRLKAADNAHRRAEPASISTRLQRRDQSQQGGCIATIDPRPDVACPTLARARRRATLMY